MAAVIDTIRKRHPDKEASLAILANVLDDVANDATARIDLDKLTQVIESAGRWQRGVSALMRINSSRIPLASLGCCLAYNKGLFWRSQFQGKIRFPREPAFGVVKVTSKGFVDRSGNTLLFPGSRRKLR